MIRMGVFVKEWPLPIMYLVLIAKYAQKFRDQVVDVKTEKFENMVRKLVVSHVIEEKEPPEEIRTAVMNIADDMMDGREAILRAGDYIALMDYGRKNKML